MNYQNNQNVKKVNELTYYDYKATTLYASRYDKRFSYFAYIPEEYKTNDNKKYPLVVLVHGTNRSTQRYRDEFKDFAENEKVIVLVPVFPANIAFPNDLSSYKFIKSENIRYDFILLDMIDELSEKYRVEKEKFLIYGFSGGGQFVHRFYYLYPERLKGVSIGAPGKITYINANKKWYVGTRNLKEEFNIDLKLQEMKRVPIQMVIGSQDIYTEEINNRNDPYWIEGLEENGRTRIQRLKALKTNYEANGIHVDFKLVEGVGHKGLPLLPEVKLFFSRVLNSANEEDQNAETI